MRERSDCCERQMCGPSRAFTMEILDNSNQLVLTFDRKFECSLYFPGCILNPPHLEVIAGSGHLLGSIVMQAGLCSFFVQDWEFLVKDSSSNVVLIIAAQPCQFGPNCICEEWCADMLTPARQRVGRSARPLSFIKSMPLSCIKSAPLPRNSHILPHSTNLTAHILPSPPLSLKNCWPGCGLRMCTKADNFEVNWDVATAFTPVSKVRNARALLWC
jgi:hypothetical protein